MVFRLYIISSNVLKEDLLEDLATLKTGSTNRRLNFLEHESSFQFTLKENFRREF